MKAIIIFLLMFIVLTLNLYSQERCGSIRNLEKIKLENPKLFEQIILLENFTQKFIANKRNSKSSELARIRIPVVVHVLYHNSSQNISANQINSQISALNDDFTRMNSDTSETPTEFKSVAANIDIEFYLTDHDPDGNNSSGITRTYTDSTEWAALDHMKYTSTGGKDAWNSQNYLNIWVCNLESPLLGYGQFPGGLDETDGVAIDYEAFGKNGTAQTPFNEGRTTTHEIGHWLNLIHIWGDDAGACSGTDLCNDTPNQANFYSSCPSHPQTSCGSHDMFMNFMDYTNDGCMNVFTEDQKDRMRALFSSCGPRRSFLYNDVAIDGSKYFCATSNYSIQNLPEGDDVFWSITPSSGIVSLTQGSNIATLNQVGDGSVTLTATINTGCFNVTRNISIAVGVPQIESITFINPLNEQGYWCSNNYGNIFEVETPYQNVTYEARLLSWPNLTVVATNSNAIPGTDPFGSIPDGFYVFQLRATNNCGTADWFGYEVEYLDCNEEDHLFRISIYPNPSSGDLKIQLVDINSKIESLIRNENIRCELIDSFHSQVMKIWNYSNFPEPQTVNISDLKPGQYTLIISVGKARQSAKVIIE